MNSNVPALGQQYSSWLIPAFLCLRITGLWVWVKTQLSASPWCADLDCVYNEMGPASDGPNHSQLQATITLQYFPLADQLQVTHTRLHIVTQIETPFPLHLSWQTDTSHHTCTRFSQIWFPRSNAKDSSYLKAPSITYLHTPRSRIARRSC